MSAGRLKARRHCAVQMPMTVSIARGAVWVRLGRRAPGGATATARAARCRAVTDRPM